MLKPVKPRVSILSMMMVGAAAGLGGSGPVAAEQGMNASDFSLTTTTGSVHKATGSNAHDWRSLLFGASQLNGAVVSAGGEHSAVNASAFSSRLSRTDEIGVKQDAGTKSGVMLSAAPFTRDRDALMITAAYLTGAGGDDTPLSDEPTSHRNWLYRIEDGKADEPGQESYTRQWEGEAWGIAAKSELWDGRLSLRGEYASSHHTYDARTADPVADQGKAVSAELLALDRQFAGHNAELYLGFDYQNIGARFRSPGRSSLLPAAESSSAYSSLSWNGLTVDLTFGADKEKLRATEVRPKYVDNWRSLDLQYAFNSVPGNRWFGRPSLSYIVDQTQTRHTDYPASYQEGPYAANILTQELSATSHYKWGELALGYTDSMEQVTLGSESDIKSNQKFVRARFKYSKHLSIGARIANNIDREIGNDSTTRSWRTTFGLNWSLVPEVLKLDLHYGFSDSRDRYDHSGSESVRFNLGWRAIEARRNRYGLYVWLKGSRYHYSQYEDANRILLGLRIQPGK